MISVKTILPLLFGVIIFVSCEKSEDENADLSALQVFSSTNLAPGSSIKEVIIINNSGNKATGSPISFTVSRFPAGSGLSYALNTGAGVKIGTDSFALSTTNWDTTGTATDITFTSKPGFVIGASSATYVGLTINRAASPNQGTSGTITQTVTIKPGSGDETPATNNTSTATLTKINVADLTASQFFSSLQIAAGQTIDEVILIRNLGSGATTAPVSFTVSNYDAATGLSVASNNNASVTIGFDTYALTNAADWNVTVGATTITFTSKAGVVIPPGGSKLVGVTITRAAAPNQGANGSIAHTVTITPGTGGGESPATNHTVFNNILTI
jgi:hypothetical protein